MSVPILQTIMEADKKNPHLTVCRTQEEPRIIHVFFCHLPFEAVPEEKRSFEYKLLVGRLYNSGTSRSELVRVFGHALSTMRRWGDAIKSGDIERLMRALGGQGAPLKITQEIHRFIEVRFPKVYAETHYDYSARIRGEIEKVFQVTVCGETLRPIFKQLKEQLLSAESAKVTLPTEDADRANSCDSQQGHQEPLVEKKPAVTADHADPDNEGGSGNRKYSLSGDPEPKALLCHHVGVLIFSGSIARLAEHLKGNVRMVMQWLVMVLLEAVNIEQSKFLDADSLRVICGSYQRNLHKQRQKLLQLSTDELRESLFIFNGQLVEIENCRDFYFDPHGKQYTGQLKLLKGWCARSRGADKVINMDFIHTCQGHPVFVSHADSFYDMRERFMEVEKEFRQVMGLPEEMFLTFVIDRGIYSMETFKQIIKEKRIHIITWQKGYKADGWDEEQINGSFTMIRYRNHATDRLQYRFVYIDRLWEKNPDMRQLIVKATNPKGNTIEVSIVTNDLSRDAQEVIRLMLRRWVQENDFKYLQNHFGINEITSYASIAYQKLKDTLRDRDVTSGEYKALQVQSGKIKKQLGKALLQEHIGKRKDKKREEKIRSLTKECKELKHQMSETQKEVSRLETIINEQRYRLDTQAKTLMDVIKIIARNMFYITLDPFRTLYNNYRDDHAFFRNLTHSHGMLIFEENRVTALLAPTAPYTPKVRKVVEKILEDINSSKPLMPDGSGRTLVLKLAERHHDLAPRITGTLDLPNS